MDLGKRLLELRSEKGLSREAFARLIGTSGAIIGRYERNERTPSVEIANNMAEALGVSLDYLVGNVDSALDPDLLGKVEELQKLPEEERSHLLYLMDSILQNFRTRKAFQ